MLKKEKPPCCKKFLGETCEYLSRIEKLMEAGIILNSMYDCSITEITDFTLEECIKITESKIGYLAFCNESETVLTMHSWSKTANKECAIINKPIIYPIETTGPWGEAIRQRKSIITNDYETSSLKKGLPSGHCLLKNHMNVPIFDENKIVLLMGVGNKKMDYDEIDVKVLNLLGQKMWKHIERRNTKKELEKFITQLRQSNESLSQFAYIASHDLKAPLRAIHNLATWIEEEIKENRNPTEYWDLLKNRVKRMESLVEGLLEYSRIGRVHIENEKIDLNKIIDDITTDLGNVTVHKTNIPQVVINKIRAFQIFSNLMVNAAKHHHDPSNIIININCNPIEANGHYLFCIEDNGPGIPPECHEKIFQIFQQLKPSDGAGIGLSIVKRIIEHYKGKIWVELEVGKGSKFYFTLPK